MPYQELLEYTKIADLGLSLDKGTNLNYEYSLPNKIFDYIHAGIPVLASNLIEVKSIVTNYKVGTVVSSHEPEEIAQAIRGFFLGLDEKELKQNLEKAASALNWENETKVLDSIYHPILNG